MKEWKKVGRIDGLYLYPLKSGKGARLSESEITKHGLKDRSGLFHDRQFMVVDANRDYKFVTGKRFNKLVLLEITFLCLDSGKIRLNAPGMKDHTFDIPLITVISTKMYGSDCKGYDCGDEVAEWIGLYLTDSQTIHFRLIYHPMIASTRSPLVNEKKYFPNAGSSDIPYYADGFTLLLTTSSSLDELNRRLLLNGQSLNLQVTEQQFRPNIHLKCSSSPPFDEDNWTQLRIGKTIFQNAQGCTRCNFTTVDALTAKRLPNNEPLSTLKTFRVKKHLFGSSSPYFGIYLRSNSLGHRIHEGDEVFVSYDPIQIDIVNEIIISMTFYCKKLIEILFNAYLTFY